MRKKTLLEIGLGNKSSGSKQAKTGGRNKVNFHMRGNPPKVGGGKIDKNIWIRQPGRVVKPLRSSSQEGI